MKKSDIKDGRVIIHGKGDKERRLLIMPMNYRMLSYSKVCRRIFLARKYFNLPRESI
jgi:hypothetical protein